MKINVKSFAIVKVYWTAQIKTANEEIKQVTILKYMGYLINKAVLVIIVTNRNNTVAHHYRKIHDYRFQASQLII